MKLVFPNGEHGQVLLRAGVNRIGSAPGGAVVIAGDGIRALHCEIHVTGTGANLQVPQGGGPVCVNGMPVSNIMALRIGDQIAIGDIIATFALVEPARSASGSGVVQDADEDTGATRVRMAVPRFVLRGVSGAVSGKMFPVAGPVVIGRAPECDITVHADEISRRHARVKPVGDGLAVEDLDSSNGTYINGRRVQQGFLDPGDELRLDAVRFMLIAPGMETSRQTIRVRPGDPAQPPQVAARKWLPILLTAVAVIVVAALVLAPVW
ncbi:FHA domain-containing protein [Luteimonas sp. XNQY3]|nr:FHA domain-containing protein [Luteimonas sp. XNQY3]MCD9008084.1 FHA domain-containing protein [Luteimonas sp. XNQY3]